MGTVSQSETVENVPVISCLEFRWNKPIILVIGISICRALVSWQVHMRGNDQGGIPSPKLVADLLCSITLWSGKEKLSKEH